MKWLFTRDWIPLFARARRAPRRFGRYFAVLLALSSFAVGTMHGASTPSNPTNSETNPQGARATTLPDVTQLPANAAPNPDTLMARPIYFPPNPPPLGTSIDIRALVRPAPPPGQRDPTVVWHAELRAYASEPFYAPLSTYLQPGLRFRHEPLVMDAKQSALFSAYRGLREKLLAELRAKILSVENSGPAERLGALENLAREQSPRLVEMERVAEELRAGLARGASWYATRQWKLGKGDLKPRERIRSLEQQLVRAAAYYQEGLSPAQRRLARELSMEMEETIFLKEDDVPTSRFFAFFSPDTSRIRLGDEIPASVTAQLAVYTREKSALKKELGDAIYEEDRAMFASARVQALSSLAKAQAGRIDALEDIAEQIRRDLAHVAGFARTRGPVELPDALNARIVKWVASAVRIARERSGVFNAAMREAMIREIAGARAAAASYGGSIEIEARTRAGQHATAAGHDAVARYNAEHAQETAANLKERDDISEEITRILGPDANLPVDALSPAFLAEFIQWRKLAGAYREYDIATFEPGLSPEQRRLLFSAAIAGLDLPQPGPDKQATVAPRTIFR